MLSLLLSTTLASQSLSAADNIHRLPELGTAAAGTLSIEKEIRIGKAYMMMLRGKLPIINDPLIDEYINDLGLRLVAQANDVKTPFHFFVVENNVINAFAFFGGNVGIHSAILLLADNESELASVVGHEITHVTQRHLARSIEARQRTNPATIAAMLASVALIMAGAPQAGLAGFQTTIALSKQLAINYTRSNEKEADRIGISLIANSSFDPQGAPDFFKKMAQSYRYATKMPPMLRSHPVTEQRISETSIRAAGYASKKLPPSLNFLLTKARILVRFAHKDIEISETLTKKQFAGHSQEHKTAYRYAQALIALKKGKANIAYKIISQLRQEDANNLFYIDTLSDIYLTLNKPQKAADMLAYFNDIKPNNQVVVLNYASVLLELKQYKLATSLLNRYVTDRPTSAIAWSLLHQIHKEADQAVPRNIARAEQMALFGDYEGALNQLYSAHNLLEKDELSQARLEARIKQFKQMRDDLKNLKI